VSRVDRRYRALLVGNWHYPDDPANLPDLKGPLNDVSRLAETLADPRLGLFARDDVAVLTERQSHEITAELEHFFAEATRQDVLLVYYSGHGVTADDGSLLLCGRNARTDRKLATMVDSGTVNRMIQQCAAAAVVILLDCCHAGAFKSGDFASDLAGKGRFVVAASRSRDRAPDAEHATGLSRFTGHLLRGLRGEAGLPGADHITLSDVYRYVHRQMTSEGPVIPLRRFDGDGEVAIARALAFAVVPPAPQVGLTVSETLIELGTVDAGELLPVEIVHVVARRPDGQPARWTAVTEADWVLLAVTDDVLRLALRPGVDASRANVLVRNEDTGETRTVRIVVKVREPQPAPADPTWVAATTAAYPPQPAAAPASPTWVAASPTADPAPRPSSPSPLRPGVLPVQVVDQALRESRIAGLELGPGTAQTKHGKAARKAARVSDAEPNLGLIRLTTGGVVFFTTQAVYWTDRTECVPIAYRNLPMWPVETSAAGNTRSAAHIMFGGLPRLVGAHADELVALLDRIRTELTG